MTDKHFQNAPNAPLQYSLLHVKQRAGFVHVGVFDFLPLSSRFYLQAALSVKRYSLSEQVYPSLEASGVSRVFRVTIQPHVSFP